MIKARSVSNKTNLLTNKTFLTQFQELNSLWQEYMNGLLDIPSLVASKWNPDDLEDPRLQQLRMKVYRADLHGAFIKVVCLVACTLHFVHYIFLPDSFLSLSDSIHW